MDPKLIELEGMLTTQSHLIELLLGAQLARGSDPVANVEKLRELLDRKFRFDMQTTSTRSHEELSGVQTAAVNHLHQILDRVRDQVSRIKESPKA